MAKIIHYRDKCIGCSVCFEMQPEIWRMSKKDGKATLLKAIEKKNIYILPLHPSIKSLTNDVAKSCPVKIIKIV